MTRRRSAVGQARIVVITPPPRLADARTAVPDFGRPVYKMPAAACGDKKKEPV
jgi:hypothetical protein